MKVYWHDRMTQRPRGLCDIKLESVKFNSDLPYPVIDKIIILFFMQI